ncbi:MAG TPA: SurA N-terminal domain-containing protein [Polyangiaceae bacterium]|jgi:peptidyl-prolyl cis-trans isomerase SurA
MKKSFRLALAGAFAFSVFAAARPAHAIIVERIVAIVGDRPILLSELRHRARPRLTRDAMEALQQGVPADNIPVQLAAAEPKEMKETLDEIIDERLMEQQADHAHLSVSIDEVDRGVKNKAQQLGITEQELWTRAHAQGYTDQDYRDEVRRQLLEGKLLQLRLAGRIHITESDAHATYDRVVQQLGETGPVDLEVLSLRIAGANAVLARQSLMQQLVLRGRNGESWCALVQQYSDDVQTRDKCGSKGVVPATSVIPVARKMLGSMKEGDISDPIQIGDQVVIAFKLAKRQAIPPYEQVREQMYDQATEEAILHQRELWVKELRRTVYLEVRL